MKVYQDFLDKYDDDFMELVNDLEKELQKQNEEYKELLDKVIMLENEHPAIINIIDGDNKQLKEDEIALQDYINTKELIQDIVNKECFRQGAKEMLMFLLKTHCLKNE